ncbi:hypothetical protein [uncultured Algimonas sp.]|uniref:hypothetical protein n=1 Tax=uncultured Algimonas sp. TaxID=1547920 RepID=UPI002605BDB2|nr:hypothetical protein [uncultured Algimonas sp.]
MNLALILAGLSVTLFAASQYERRAASAPAWLSALIRILAVVILLLAAFYFYQRFTA